MGSRQCFMLAVAGLTLVMFANAQTAPKPCCLPSLYSVGQTMLLHLPAQGDMPEELLSTDGMYYFDKPNQRIAINGTFQILTSKQPAAQVHQILDYSKKMSYMILNNTVCQEKPLEGKFPNNLCIPDKAMFKGTVKLGDSYAVNQWLYQGNNDLRQVMTMQVDKCVPITMVQTMTEQEGIFMESFEYFNFKASIDKPDAQFKPPSFCKSAPVLKTKNSIDRVLRSSFAIPAMDPESSDS